MGTFDLQSCFFFAKVCVKLRAGFQSNQGGIIKRKDCNQKYLKFAFQNELNLQAPRRCHEILIIFGGLTEFMQ